MNDIIENNDKYGNFGICIKNSWIKKYLGQPVLYSALSTYNNQILIQMDDLISKTHDLYLNTKDDGIDQVSLEIADLVMLLQALMEPMNHKPEKEIRVINYPKNKNINRDLVTWCEETITTNNIAYSPIHFLPISEGEDAEFFIMPKRYQEIFYDRVVNPDRNGQKLRFIEDILKYKKNT